MNPGQRTEIRRGSDVLIIQIVEYLRILSTIIDGEDYDFGEPLADLIGMKEEIGRRQDDEELIDELCGLLEKISVALVEKKKLLEIAEGKLPGKKGRRVRLTKLESIGKSDQTVGTTIDGWERMKPVEGKIYVIYKDNGKVYKTTALTKLYEDRFQTRNSIYKIEVINTP